MAWYAVQVEQVEQAAELPEEGPAPPEVDVPPQDPALGAPTTSHKRKRRKRGEEPHARGSKFKPLGTSVLVPLWAQGKGKSRLLPRDALRVALDHVLRGGPLALCADGGDHKLDCRHVPLKGGREGYRVTCAKKCAVTLKVLMTVGGESLVPCRVACSCLALSL
jgi:hypothetical protein